MIPLEEVCVGDKVYYQPEHYKPDLYENGIVKEIPEGASNFKNSILYNRVRVVYHCANDWEHYQDYTSALTNLEDLNKGWK